MIDEPDNSPTAGRRKIPASPSPTGTGIAAEDQIYNSTLKLQDEELADGVVGEVTGNSDSSLGGSTALLGGGCR